MSRGGVSRRDFLRATGLGGAGALVLACLPRRLALADPGPEGPAFRADAWLAITADDRIVLQLDKVEMGQGIATGYATLVGEELRTDPARVEVVPAPVHPDFQRPTQTTGGSRSLRTAWETLRPTAARAREMLRHAAAARLGVPPARVVVEQGGLRVEDGTRSVSFGEVAAEAARRPVPRRVVLTPASEFRWIGRPQPARDALLAVTGRTVYGIDVQRPGLRTAVVAHCPVLGGELRRFDAEAALARPGVEAVFAIPGGVAVVADGYWRARQALEAMEIEWSQEAAPLSDSAAIRAQLARRLDRGHGRGARDEGDVEAAFEAALEGGPDEPSARLVQAEYELPLLAHATMEPMNCTVVPGEERCDVYVGSQAPDAVQDVVAERLGLDRDAVHVHTPAIGGGFGRRLLPDVAAEAAEIARRFEGPVKLVWSREDDMARDAYRPPSLHRLRALLDEGGALAAWEHCMALPSLLPDLGPDAVRPMAPQWLRPLVQRLARGATWATPRLFGPVLGVEGAAELPYAAPHLRVTGAAQDIGVPVGMWRSVGHSHNGFVVESFVDELAHAAGSDPADFRRAHLAGHPRHRAVLEALVEAADWGSPPAVGARGMALHESFDSVVGQVAEVSVAADGAIRVHRVICVVDCGLVVNPEVVRAQMEGGIVFGLTAALHGRLTVEQGRVRQSNFHDYPLLRMAEAPAIAVHLMPSDEPPTGVGEPGTPPIAAAVGNAVFAATGVRLRTLPFDLAAARSAPASPGAG